MTTPGDEEIDWSLCTWKGSRRKQHQDFNAIPFRRKLEIIEEMSDAIREFHRASECSRRDTDQHDPAR
jgi:hypothetical protein